MGQDRGRASPGCCDAGEGEGRRLYAAHPTRPLGHATGHGAQQGARTEKATAEYG